MTRSIRALSSILLLAVAVAGCGEGNGLAVTGGGNGQTGGDVVVTLTAGEGLGFAWTRGSARALTVSRADGTAVLWRVQAIDAAVGFEPPVDYGDVPAGSTQDAPAATLQTGVLYRVSVTTSAGENGFREFTL